MVPFDMRAFKQSGPACVVTWMGRSGRLYEVAGENLDQFRMTPSDLYLIAKGGNVLWVGSANDLVGDPLSRARFRLALDCADRVFRLVAPGAESERLGIIWDLEGAEPIQGLSAA